MLNTTLIREYLDNKLRRYPSIFIEALFMTIVSIILSQLLYYEESGIVSLFFLSILLRQRMKDILAQNRIAIFEKKSSSTKANINTTFQFIVIFSAIFFIYSFSSFLLPKEFTSYLFKKQLSICQINPENILIQNFGQFNYIAMHNLIVLLLVMMFSFFFQYFGAIFVLGLNASIWGVVLSLIIQNTISQNSFNPFLFFLCAFVSIIPHLLMEAGAYVLGSLSAIFISKAFIKYPVASNIFNRVIWASIKMALLAVIIIILSAIVETTIPSFFINHFFSKFA